MNKRTLVLCASVGALLLSATPMTAFETSGLSSVLSASEQPAEVPPPRKDGPFLERLRAAYGSAEAPNASETSSAPATPVDVEKPTLWLARAIYSETKLPHEQELVAWVVRNRVETNYRGQNTYRKVVLDPYQFSAFNPGSSKRRFLMGLTPETELAGWQQALWVAYYVRHADPVYRPFSIKTRHFYSERSMRGQRPPYWAEWSQFVSPGWNYLIDERRFRFFEQIS